MQHLIASVSISASRGKSVKRASTKQLAQGDEKGISVAKAARGEDLQA